MKAKKILCPVDFSPCSTVAFEHAVDLARGSQAKLLAVNVTAPPPTYVSGYTGFGAMPPYRPEPDPRLKTVEIDDASVDLERVHLVGIEGESIVRYAAESDCDLIVMGTHGYGGFTKFLLGSVADYVIRHAKCAVVVMRDRIRESQATDSNSAAHV